jgi:hypothetical protein
MHLFWHKFEQFSGPIVLALVLLGDYSGRRVGRSTNLIRVRENIRKSLAAKILLLTLFPIGTALLAVAIGRFMGPAGFLSGMGWMFVIPFGFRASGAFDRNRLEESGSTPEQSWRYDLLRAVGGDRIGNTFSLLQSILIVWRVVFCVAIGQLVGAYLAWYLFLRHSGIGLWPLIFPMRATMAVFRAKFVVWCGGSFATLPSYILGLVWQNSGAARRKGDNRFILFFLGALSVGISIAAAIVTIALHVGFPHLARMHH